MKENEISPKNLEKKINQFITLKLENRKTFIYVNGKRFIQCIRLILNIPKGDVRQYDEIESIDEAAGLYNKHIYQNRIVEGPMARIIPDGRHDITPEQEFWGHCSNIQAWVEHNYDTQILMTNISFPLLRRLSNAGDALAKKVFKEEIAMRLSSGYPSVVQYLINQKYLDYFTPEEFETIVETPDFIENIVNNSKILDRLLSSFYRSPKLLEVILLKILMLPDGKDYLMKNIRECVQSQHGSPIMNDLVWKIRYGRSNSRYLVSLKKTLENLLLKENINDNTGEDIIECIETIESTAKARNIDLVNIPMTYPEIIKRDPKVIDYLINSGILNKVKLNMNRFHSRCSYCGKIIPKGQDVCEWCGHRRYDDDDFLPYPYIFKPPDDDPGVGLGKKKRVIVGSSITEYVVPEEEEQHYKG